MMLPPQGKPGHKTDEKDQTLAYDATVNDWAWDGSKALTEPETSYEWVNYKSTTPGKRQEILFDAANRQTAVAVVATASRSPGAVLAESQRRALVGADPSPRRRQQFNRAGETG